MSASRINKVGRPSLEAAELKHRAILETALKEFASRGFHGASIRTIADKAGLSTRTLYNRYPDKATLFAGCLEMTSREIEALLIENQHGDLRHRLVSFLTNMQIQLFSERSTQMARLIYREQTEFTEVREIARLQFYRYQVGPVERILMDNKFNTADIHGLASHFISLGLGRWQRTVIFYEPPLTPDAIFKHAEEVTNIFLQGVSAYQSS